MAALETASNPTKSANESPAAKRKEFAPRCGRMRVRRADRILGTIDPFAGAAGGPDQFFVGGPGGAFLIPANNKFGNCPRNGLFEPRFVNRDMSHRQELPTTQLARRFAERAQDHQHRSQPPDAPDAVRLPLAFGPGL